VRGVVVRGGVLVDEDQPVTTTSGLTTPPHRWHRGTPSGEVAPATTAATSWGIPHSRQRLRRTEPCSSPRVRQRSVDCVQLGVQVQDVVDVVVEEHLRAAAMISRRAPVARSGWGMSRSCHGASVVLIPPSRRRDSAIPLWYHEAMAMTLRLTEEQERALTLLAQADGISKQEATVRAIMDAASRRVHDERVRDLSSAARARYADLLDRLGQ